MDQPLPEVTDDDIVQAMIGRELNDLFPEVPPVGEETALEVKGLHVSGYPAAVDLSVRRGEILGLAGLVGAGRTELLEAMFGVRKSTAGAVSVAGTDVRRNSPAVSITHGMALVPEDRKGAGVVLTMNVLDNGSLPRLSSFTLGGWLRQGARGRAVKEAMSSVRLRSRGMTPARGDALGRQPAEGRPRAVADRARRRAPAGRADAWRRRRGTQRDLPHHHRARRRPAWRSSWRHPTCRRSSASPTGRWSCADGAVVAELDRAALSAPDVQERVFRLAAGLDPGDPSPASRPAGADSPSAAGSSRSATPTTVSPTTKEDVR